MTLEYGLLAFRALKHRAPLAKCVLCVEFFDFGQRGTASVVLRQSVPGILWQVTGGGMPTLRKCQRRTLCVLQLFSRIRTRLQVDSTSISGMLVYSLIMDAADDSRMWSPCISGLDHKASVAKSVCCCVLT